MFRILLLFVFICSVLPAQESLEEVFPYTRSFTINNLHTSRKYQLSVLGNGKFREINTFTLKISEEILGEYYAQISPEEDYPLRIIVYPSLYAFLRETSFSSVSPFRNKKQKHTLRVFFTGDYISYYFLLRRAIADFVSHNLFLQAELWNKINYDQIPTWEIPGTALFLSGFTPEEQVLFHASASKIPEVQFSHFDEIPYEKYLFTGLPLQFIGIKYGKEKTRDILRVLKLTANFKTLLYIVSTGLYKDYPYYHRFLKAVKNPDIYAPKIPNISSAEALKNIPVEEMPLGFATDKNHKFTAYAFLQKKYVYIKVFSYEKNKSAVIGKFKTPAPVPPLLRSFVKIPMAFYEDKIYLADFKGDVFAFDISERKWTKIVKKYFFAVSAIYEENGKLIIEGFNGKNTGAFFLDTRRGKLSPLFKDRNTGSLVSASLPAFISYEDSVFFRPYQGKIVVPRGKKDSVLMHYSDLPRNLLLKARIIGGTYVSLHFFPDLRCSKLVVKDATETKILSSDSTGVLNFFVQGDDVFYYTFSEKALVLEKANLTRGLPPERFKTSLSVKGIPPLKTKYYEEEKKTGKKKNPLQYYVFDDEETEEYATDSMGQTPPQEKSKTKRERSSSKHIANGAELLDANSSIGLDPYFRLYFRYDIAVSDILKEHVFTLSHNIFFKTSNQDVFLKYYYNRYVPKFFGGVRYSQRVETEYAIFKYRRSEVFAGTFYRSGKHRLEGILSYNKFRKIDVRRFDFIDYSSEDNALLPQIKYTFDNVKYAYRAPVKGNYWEVQAQYFHSLKEKMSFYTLQFTARKYLRLVRGVVVAAQGKGGISQGDGAQTFLLGGVQEWLNYQFQYKENLPFNNSASSFMMMEYVTPVRGFAYNSRNGNKYLLLNNELRFYTSELFGSSFPYKGVNKFIFTLFYDVGTAWTYGNPLSQKNPVNKTEISAYPLLITVENFKNPFIISTGVANTLIFSSLTLRYSLAWLIEDSQLAGTFFSFGFGKDF